MRTTTRAALALLALAPLARAQGTFTSGSNGSDGALTIAGAQGTIDFDPTTFDPPLDPDGDNVYHFTTISVGAGTTLRLSTRHLPEGRPVFWLASGEVTIAGTLDLNGDNGHDAGATPTAAFAGAGGYSGGRGRTPQAPPSRGNGPGGGSAGLLDGEHGGSAGHVVAGIGPNNTGGGAAGPTGATYGNEYLRPLQGGSGGGGANEGNPPGGGGGGGAILVASSASISLTGSILARGGNSGNASGRGIPGGAGSGGAVRLIAPVVQGAGTINVSQGAGTLYTGSPGRVRLEAFRFPSTPSVLPTNAAPSRGVPGVVFEPASAPTIKVVRIGGVAVAAEPTGSFVVPDVVISAAGPVAVELEARNVPVGAVLNLTFQPEVGAEFTASSSPLAAGTGGVSTATATVTFPGGFTRVFVRASWTP